jgi:hypothetical protein
MKANEGGGMEETKPGTTRLMFFAVPIILLILGAVVILFAVKADTAGLEKLAILAIGSLTTALGLIMGYYYGAKNVS